MKRFLPGLVVLLLIAAVLAALAVRGRDDPAPRAASPSPSATPTASRQPTERPAPAASPSRRGRLAAAPSASPSSKPRLVIYEVQPGDSLSAIAWKVHVPVEALYLWNLIVVGPWPDRIYSGQPLIIGKE